MHGSGRLAELPAPWVQLVFRGGADSTSCRRRKAKFVEVRGFDLDRGRVSDQGRSRGPINMNVTKPRGLGVEWDPSSTSSRTKKYIHVEAGMAKASRFSCQHVIKDDYSHHYVEPRHQPARCSGI